MSQILFLSDLDHNLFQSKRVDAEGIHPMTVNKEGEAHCFATPAQKALLSLMAKNAFCIAVTARNPAQMMRVTGWETQQQHDLALTDLGMTLLYRVDKGEWQTISLWSEPYLREAKAIMHGIQVDFAQLSDDLMANWPDDENGKRPIKLKMVYCHEAPEVPFYFVIQVEKQHQHRIGASDVRAVAKVFLSECQGDYFYHESENTYAFWPTYVSKYKAVQRLLNWLEDEVEDERVEMARREKGRHELIMSSGDSLSDLSFMKSAHFWMAPTVSQISAAIERHEVLSPADYEEF